MYLAPYQNGVMNIINQWLLLIVIN